MKKVAAEPRYGVRTSRVLTFGLFRLTAATPEITGALENGNKFHIVPLEGHPAPLRCAPWRTPALHTSRQGRATDGNSKGRGASHDKCL